ncbi:hypothetical protein P7C71_g3809, partial [Lecanoromycetidae sp. Uapishka_2]
MVGITSSKDAPTYDSVVLANTPDSWSFQHFLDRVTHIITQVKPNDVNYAVSSKPHDQIVRDMWEALGFEPDYVLGIGKGFVAARFIWSCRAPLIHPWPTREFLRSLEASPSQGVPIEDRKIIMYMTRSDGHASHGGREILNEAELLVSLRQLMDERGMGEEVQVFDPSEYKDTASLINYFRDHVEAVIGPHGGALLNHLWTGSDTLVLEMQPDTFRGMGIFEGAKVLDQQYASLMLDGDNGSTNMYADIPAVLDIFRTHLGQRVGNERNLKIGYDIWNAKELQLG